MYDTSHYDQLKAQGYSPAQIVEAAKNDRVDDIQLLKLLRTLFGLSLPDAKKALHGRDPFESVQSVALGATLYWEGWEYFEGKKYSYYKSGVVKEIASDHVILTNVVKHEYNGGDELQEIPYPSNFTTRIALNYFDKTLLDRLSENEELAELLMNG